MTTLYTGKKGNAKTLLCIKTVHERSQRENRPVYYHGILDLTLDWRHLDDPHKWYECPPNSIIVIDECDLHFPAKANGSPVPHSVEQFKFERKQGHDVYLITQHPTFIHTHIRKLVDDHYHLIRIFGKEKSNMYYWQKCRANPDEDRSDAIVKEVDFPKEYYGTYKSADVHNIKTKVPLKYHARWVFPPLVLALFAYGIYAFMGASDGELVERSIKQADSAYNGSQQQQYRRGSNEPQYNFYEARAERVQGLPHTAPIYDEVTEPIEAPLPAACVDFKGQCICYTQQATKMTVSPDVCRQIVDKGYFIDFVNGDALQTKQRQQQVSQASFERVVTEAPVRGEKVEPAAVAVHEHQGSPQDVRPGVHEVRSPSKLTRERMAASEWAFKPPAN